MANRDKIDFDKLPLHMKQIVELSDNFQSDKYPKCRCFYLVDGKVVFGVAILETEDSFLVGAPARMVRPTPDSDIEVDPLYDSSVIRVLKASVALVTVVSHKFRFLYLDYLSEAGSKLLPDYMTEERVNGTLELMSSLTGQSLNYSAPNAQTISPSIVGTGNITVH
jgi:hypothetical protein